MHPLFLFSKPIPVFILNRLAHVESEKETKQEKKKHAARKEKNLILRPGIRLPAASLENMVSSLGREVFFITVQLLLPDSTLHLEQSGYIPCGILAKNTTASTRTKE